MMKVLGITAEYDPIHIGHVHHIDESMRMSGADFCVAVMSGDFTQRGEPAMLSKWVRAEMAVRSGIDLVVELPFSYASAGAPRFAEGAVRTLDAMGCVSHISFGSESGDIDMLFKIAGLLSSETPDFRRLVRKYLDMGRGFPKARELAVSDILGEEAAGVLTKPNNILGIEYLSALKKTGLERKIKALTIGRKGMGHGETGRGEKEGAQGYPSSSMIRKISREYCRDPVEENKENIAAMIPKGAGKVFFDHIDEVALNSMIWPFARARILQMKRDELENVSGVIEGVENRMKRFVRTEEGYEAYIDKVRSARFSKAAVHRMMLHVLMGMTKSDENLSPEYIRILGAGKRGRKLLNMMKKEKLAKVPVITNPNKAGAVKESRLLELDMLASDMYNLAVGLDLYENSDRVRMPYIETEW